MHTIIQEIFAYRVSRYLYLIWIEYAIWLLAPKYWCCSCRFVYACTSHMYTNISLHVYWQRIEWDNNKLPFIQLKGSNPRSVRVLHKYKLGWFSTRQKAASGAWQRHRIWQSKFLSFKHIFWRFHVHIILTLARTWEGGCHPQVVF